MKKINFKLTMMFTMALAAQLLLEDMEPELKFNGVDANWRRETRFGLGEISKNLGKALSSFNKARTAYEMFIEPSRERCMRDKETGKFSVQNHDDNMRDANELIRMAMLYYDRCFLDFANVNAVFKFLRELPGQDIFTDEDIERFRM